MGAAAPAGSAPPPRRRPATGSPGARRRWGGTGRRGDPPTRAGAAARRARSWPVGGWGVFTVGLAGGVLLAGSAALVRPAPGARTPGWPVHVWPAAPDRLAIPVWLAGTLLLTGAWLALGRRIGAIGTGGMASPVAGAADPGARGPGAAGPQSRPGVGSSETTRPGVGAVLATGLPWILPLLAAPPLASRDAYAYACQGTLVDHGLDPYTQGVAALPCPWLSTVPHLWWHTPAPYGPLWLALAGAASAPGGLAVALAVLRLLALAGLALAGWAGHRLITTLTGPSAAHRRAGRRTPWRRADPGAARHRPSADPTDHDRDPGAARRGAATRAVWLALLNPLVLVHAVTGVHNDALLAGLVLAGLAVAVRLRRHAWAALPVGLLFALVVGIKATGLVALPFAVLALAGDRGWRPIARSAGLALTGLAGGYATLWAITGYGLGWLPALSGTADLVQWTSPPTAVGMTAGYALRAVGLAGASPAVLAVVRVVALVVLAAVLLGLWVWARGGLPTGPHPASSGARNARRVVLAAGYALAAVTLLGPVAFPWYALVPLAVLGHALPGEPARRRLAWFAAGCALLVLPDGTGLAALTKLPGALLMTLAVIMVTVRASAAFRRRRLPAAADPAIPTPTTR